MAEQPFIKELKQTNTTLDLKRQEQLVNLLKEKLKRYSPSLSGDYVIIQDDRFNIPEQPPNTVSTNTVIYR